MGAKQPNDTGSSNQAGHWLAMTIEGFMDRVMPEPNSGCWLWMGNLADKRGYGLVSVRSGDKYIRIGAHRFSWQLHKGPIPKGILVCHHCDVPSCVNPDHLFLGTHSDNTKDAHSKGRMDAGEKWRTKTHCPQGHQYDEANTFRYQGRRYCRACGRKYRKTYRDGRK